MKSALFLFTPLVLCAFAFAPTPAKEPALCTVQGQVVEDPGAKPIRKVQIQMASLSEEQGEQSVYTALTDAEGRFTLEKVKPGKYRLFLQRIGFVGADKHTDRLNRVRMSLNLEPGQEVKDLVYHMRAAAVITGKVVDNDGDPEPNAQVMVVRPRSSPRSSQFATSGFAQTNDLGEFRVGGLAPGKYIVSATPTMRTRLTLQTGGQTQKEENILTTTYYPATADRSQAVPVEVHAGDEVPVNIGLVSTRAFHVRGSLDNAVSAGHVAAVVLLPKDRTRLSAAFKEDEVEKNGSFDIAGVLPGSYSASVILATSGVPETFGAVSTIEVRNSDVEGVHLTPVPVMGQIRGQFRMDDGSRVDWSKLTLWLDSDDEERANLMSYSQEGISSDGQVKGDGSFELKKVPVGRYHVLVNSADRSLRDYFVKAVNLGGKDVGDSGFAVAGGSYSLDLIVSAKGAAIEGVVVDAKNQPVPDATIIAVPDAKRRGRKDLYQQDTTDQHGHFRVHGLNPGDYSVLAFEDLEDDFHDQEFLKSYESRAQSVKLEEGGHESVVVKVIPASDEQ